MTPTELALQIRVHDGERERPGYHGHTIFADQITMTICPSYPDEGVGARGMLFTKFSERPRDDVLSFSGSINAGEVGRIAAAHHIDYGIIDYTDSSGQPQTLELPIPRGMQVYYCRLVTTDYENEGPSHKDFANKVRVPYPDVMLISGTINSETNYALTNSPEQAIFEIINGCSLARLALEYGDIHPEGMCAELQAEAKALTQEYYQENDLPLPANFVL